MKKYEVFCRNLRDTTSKSAVAWENDMDFLYIGLISTAFLYTYYYTFYYVCHCMIVVGNISIPNPKVFYCKHYVKYTWVLEQAVIWRYITPLEGRFQCAKIEIREQIVDL